MHAWLVVNEFLHSDKFNEIHRWLLNAAGRKGIHCVLKTNAECIATLFNGNVQFCSMSEKPDFVIFWDKDVRLAELFEQNQIRVFNSSKAIAVCDDKSYTQMILNKAGIKMPKTMLAPMTYAGVGYTNLNFLQQVEEQLSYPIVCKECFGSFGQQVYLVHSRKELEHLTKELEGKPILYQEFIETSNGRDVRLEVVGDQVVASMYRYSETDFRANITNGGKMIAYSPNKYECELAVKCCKLLGLDFGGVDFLFGNHESIVCEVNSNAHFKNIYDCTKVNAADYIFDYIVEKMQR